MSHRLGVRLLAAILPISAVLVVPAAARAEHVVTKDAAGDASRNVSNEVIAPEADEPEFVPAPEHEAVDITRTVVDHRAERLRVTVRYQDLRRDFQHYQFVEVHTPEKKFNIIVERLGGPAFPVLGNRQGDLLGCLGLKASVQQSTDRISVSVPTSCLGNPRWVRVGVGATGTDRDAMAAHPDNDEYFFDDANTTVPFQGGPLRMGPKVHRD